MDVVSMGKQIRAYRAKRGWTQEECAERVGITSRYLADIERGYKTPKLETLVHILNVLGASADDVLQDSLTIGYAPKSNALLERLNTLSDEKKAQSLEIFDCVIKTMEKNR